VYPQPPSAGVYDIVEYTHQDFFKSLGASITIKKVHTHTHTHTYTHAHTGRDGAALSLPCPATVKGHPSARPPLKHTTTPPLWQIVVRNVSKPRDFTVAPHTTITGNWRGGWSAVVGDAGDAADDDDDGDDDGDDGDDDGHDDDNGMMVMMVMILGMMMMMA
jgi:hypothetical protein